MHMEVNKIALAHRLTDSLTQSPLSTHNTSTEKLLASITSPDSLHPSSHQAAQGEGAELNDQGSRKIPSARVRSSLYSLIN
jgi:hypothetical protein